MSRSDALQGVAEFLAVAEQASFRRAAGVLGVTPAAVSQAVRALELRTGVALFHRTTRKVGLTEAGEALKARLAPAMADMTAAFDRLDDFRSRPQGHLRLTVPRLAVDLVMVPVLPVLRRLYPEVTVEVAVQDAAVDLADEGFDAGIRIGEFIARDMITLALTRDFHWVVAGTPGYFDTHGRPSEPRALLDGHDCIRYRYPTSGMIYRWEFERATEACRLDPPGATIVNDAALMRELALAGLGLIYAADLQIADDLAAGRLETVLADWLPVSDGLRLYFPDRSRNQPKLRAFIDVARRVLRERAVALPASGREDRA